MSAAPISAIYAGRVRHGRRGAVAHAFRYRLFMLYLDLDELPGLFDGRWLWSARRPNLCWFRRADYLGDPRLPLKEAVLDLVEQRLGRRPAGPVRLLTNLRTLGYLQNPVSFYWCFGADAATPEAVVAEITNTPWGERHAYVLDWRAGEACGATRRFQFEKEFHVSPFFEMELGCDWRLAPPGERLAVHMLNRREGRPIFDAALALARRPFSGRNLAAVLARHPWITAKVFFGIYWQALRLRLKGASFHAHPRNRAVPPARPETLPKT